MSNNKLNQQPSEQPAQDKSDSNTEALKSDWTRGGFVTNTRPAPPNPHQEGEQKEKK